MNKPGNMNNAGKKLRFGLPYGSLLDRKRWDTSAFLMNAGFHISPAYRPDSREYNPGFLDEEFRDYLEAVAVRPQRVPRELWASVQKTGSKGLDISITGIDWAEEGKAAGYPISKLCSLGYGKVDIVAAVHENHVDVENLGALLEKKRKEDTPLICTTEYIHTAAKYISENATYKKLYGDEKPLVLMGGRKIKGKNMRVVVEYSEQTTEISGPSGFSDMIVENSQTGETLRLNNYRILESISRSFARLYMGPHVIGDEWMLGKAKYIADRLRGAALAKKYIYCIFDFPASVENQIKQYLMEHHLYEVQPFILREGDMRETKILVPRLKNITIIEGLQKIGAEAVVGLGKIEWIVALKQTEDELDKMIEDDDF